MDESTRHVGDLPEGGDRSESRPRHRSSGSGLLLVTAAVAGVLCLGGGGMALFGVLSQSGRPVTSQPAVPGADVTDSAPPESGSAPAPTAPADSPLPSAGKSPAVYYASCAEVRAAGAAPLRAGQPGYRVELDRDRDGLACEKKER